MKVLKTLAFTRRILMSLAGEVKDALYNYEKTQPNDPLRHWHTGWTLEDKIWAEKTRAKRALIQLREKRFIEIRKQGGKIAYRLTDKGRVAALKDMIRISGKRGDGKITMVSFDIPEQENAVRCRLRYLLKDLEFKFVQRSLWASELDISDIIAKAIIDVGADKWVKVYLSQEIKRK